MPITDDVWQYSQRSLRKTTLTQDVPQVMAEILILHRCAELFLSSLL